MEQQHKQKILIADDSEINRSILSDMLGEEYDIIEAEDGVQAVLLLQQYGTDISLLLLDIVMPNMDGFGVLAAMNQHHWIDDIPVIMISSERGSSHVERAYDMGVTDFINRPFDALIVHRRVVNTILLYSKQKKLINLVADQIYEKEQRSSLMIDILSHIVEFRNGESGLHVVHVRTLTEFMLQCLIQKTDRYAITPADITLIGMASALHDIGKIAIPENVLNKPGRLTDEEFAIMKTHSSTGAAMLENLPFHQDEPLVRTAYSICRWHHERYDGRGYPDGLKGDDIPISAQIVALADVYDALTSERVYKPAFSHEQAIEMIVAGQCGVFNPLLIECLSENADQLAIEMSSAANMPQNSRRDMRNVLHEMQQHEELTASERTIQLLEHERTKFNFFAALTEDIQFEFITAPPMITLSPFGATKLGFPEVIPNPFQNEAVLRLFDPADLGALSDALRATSPGHPQISFECKLNLEGGARWHRIVSQAIWSSDEPPRYTGAIGKAIDIHDSHTMMEDLERKASTDALTGLLNHANAKERIQTRLDERPDGLYALVIFDLDLFKLANDTYGHLFGDELLKHLADKLRTCIRGGDIAARVGGDEFLIFLEYKTEPESTIHRIYNSLCGKFGDFNISLSMGVAVTKMLGTDYSVLFQAADRALYSIKRGQRGKGAQYRFYDDSMSEGVSAISPIDGGAAAQTADDPAKEGGSV